MRYGRTPHQRAGVKRPYAKRSQATRGPSAETPAPQPPDGRRWCVPEKRGAWHALKINHKPVGSFSAEMVCGVVLFGRPEVKAEMTEPTCAFCRLRLTGRPVKP